MNDQANKKKRSKKLGQFKPSVVSIDSSYKNREIASSVLPEGASLVPIKKTSDISSSWTGQSFFGGSGGSSTFHTQRPYMPEFDSPDRQFYPINRAEANRYWRLFYKVDPFFGTAVDMYSAMMFGSFEVILDNENDQTIKNQIMDMCDKVSLLDKLQTMVKEFLVLGEAFPHCYFSEELGIWTYLGFHNPDYIDVQDSSIIDMDPILHYLPDDNIREMLTDNTPESIELRKRLPSEFVSKVLAKQKIRLSPLNCSYIPRKLHPYDERGTSLASRLWRIWMVEDAVYNSTIAMFRRSASALKVLKLGDASSGYIPSPSVQQDYLRMLAQSELDPQSWLVTSYAANFESWGNQEKTVTLSREHDTIEKVKLVALGLSKSFMVGEQSFSSAKSGLQVFLRRLLSMRQFFEKVWLLPKFFQPIIQINDWVKSTPSEVNHKYRIKRTAQEKLDNNMFVNVRLNWRNKLDPKVDEETLRAYMQLKNFGFDVSNDTVGNVVSLDWRDELRKKASEFKEKDELLTEVLGPTLKQKYEEANKPAAPKPPGGTGSGAMPPSGAKPPKAPMGVKPTSTPPGSSGMDESKTPIDEPVEPPSDGGGNSL